MINQFDVVVNSSDGRGNIPYLLVLQHRLIDAAKSVVVAPLHRVPTGNTLNPKLCPPITVENGTYSCVMYQLAAVPIKSLGAVVANAIDQRDDIIRAYDIIISGI